MKSKSKDLKKKISIKRASLGRVLKTNEKIKETINKDASELTSVNEVLNQEKVPVQVMKQALTQNEDVEQKVEKAAGDLKLVNVKLAKVMTERIAIESEMRGPVLRGWAVILEVELEGGVDHGTLQLKAIGPNDRCYRKHFLHLGGLGIQDLCRQGSDLLFLVRSRNV